MIYCTHKTMYRRYIMVLVNTDFNSLSINDEQI